MSTRLDFGFILAGSYLNTAVFTLELVLLWNYANTKAFKRDPKLVRIPVLVTFLVDIVGMVGVIAWVIKYLFNRGIGPPGRAIPWPIPLVAITTVINAFLVQCFMIRRYYKFSRFKALAILLFVLTIASFAILIAGAGISFTLTKDYAKNKERHRIPCRPRLNVHNGPSNRRPSNCQALELQFPLTPDALVKRLTILAIQTGCAPTIVVITCLVAFWVKPESSIAPAFAMSLGSIYTTTMLFTLNRRNYLRSSTSTIHSVNDTHMIRNITFEGTRVSASPDPRSHLSAFTSKTSDSSKSKSRSRSSVFAKQKNNRATRVRSNSLSKRLGGIHVEVARTRVTNDIWTATGTLSSSVSAPLSDEEIDDEDDDEDGDSDSERDSEEDYLSLERRQKMDEESQTRRQDEDQDEGDSFEEIELQDQTRSRRGPRPGSLDEVEATIDIPNAPQRPAPVVHRSTIHPSTASTSSAGAAQPAQYNPFGH
ncbi:hypothetical protein CC1G_00630 [Coprinopsis cinerea okayama7|uniref:DUF6534 domain-containing protein n=1 Tax=Coprinopsis cinerea (strain Okayama-7 / 130 / ATCC MYA-4618 / FGSC 9003) TaxID=240176 RepID=A8N3L1_COPC7|nr:hypothetical protein CC1G_00630 [Coprinopsis cinerea okayama7\|eukprot:XP_001829451.2 hypothetical protein CC1G_00630 [Coprinopsis cinerea okayama7\